MLERIGTAICTILMGVSGFAVTFGQEPNSLGQAQQITNSIGMKLTLVPAGEFQMGNSEPAEKAAAFFSENYRQAYLEARHFANEQPQHLVRITEPFYLGTYHVTRGQFRQFVEASGYTTEAETETFPHKPGIFGMNPETGAYEFNPGFSWRHAGFEQTDEHPVVHINWNDATAFCQWLSQKEGRSYRLPSEAEWEYACRAGTTNRYFSGDDPETLARVANTADQTFVAKYPRMWAIRGSDGYVFTAPVGQFEPNAWGLYDMLGNAGQWCADWYAPDYYDKSPQADPSGPSSAAAAQRSIDHRVLRGSNWHSNPADARSAKRSWYRPDSRDSEYSGFRVALSPPGR